jgi:hypothetical protein
MLRLFQRHSYTLFIPTKGTLPRQAYFCLIFVVPMVPFNLANMSTIGPLTEPRMRWEFVGPRGCGSVPCTLTVGPAEMRSIEVLSRLLFPSFVVTLTYELLVLIDKVHSARLPMRQRLLGQRCQG